MLAANDMFYALGDAVPAADPAGLAGAGRRRAARAPATRRPARTDAGLQAADRARSRRCAALHCSIGICPSRQGHGARANNAVRARMVARTDGPHDRFFLPATGRPREMSDIILETRQLTKEFKGFTAVSKVDLSVVRGSIHALIGPNGAGKTTCFNLLTKFLEPTSGTILFNGQDITRERPAQIARRGIIRSFQISAVFPHLTLAGERAPGPAARAGHLVPLLEEREVAQAARRAGARTAGRGRPGRPGRRADREPALRPQARARDRHHAGDGARADAARRTHAGHGPRGRAPRGRTHQARVGRAAPS